MKHDPLDAMQESVQTLHPSCIQLLRWFLQRSVKWTWTSSAFSTNESASSAMGTGSQSRVVCEVALSNRATNLPCFQVISIMKCLFTMHSPGKNRSGVNLVQFKTQSLLYIHKLYPQLAQVHNSRPWIVGPLASPSQKFQALICHLALARQVQRTQDLYLALASLLFRNSHFYSASTS